MSQSSLPPSEPATPTQVELKPEPAPIAHNVPAPAPPSPATKADIYASPYHSIFLKNFTAGFARALGSIVLYLIFLLILSYLVSVYLLPHVKPYLDSFLKLSEVAANPSIMKLPGNLNPPQ